MSLPLRKIRDTWQFANLCQWIFLFGHVAKIPDRYTAAVLEQELLQERSDVLVDIGLALLRCLSSNRHLTPENWEEYTRRQYLARAPARNPFAATPTDGPDGQNNNDGDNDHEPSVHENSTTKNGDTAVPFHQMDTTTKLQILQQLTQWIMAQPERLREKFPEKSKDADQTEWRIEPIGWDRHDRTYFLLDDNRLYRMTEAPPPSKSPKKAPPAAKPAPAALPAAPSKKRKIFRAGTRSSKRRRTSQNSATALVDEGDTSMLDESSIHDEPERSETVPEPGKQEEPEPEAYSAPFDDTLGGRKWECLAVSLAEAEAFLASLASSKNAQDKALSRQIRKHLVPILERDEQAQKRREQQLERERQAQAKLAQAKRSSRIATKHERQRHEDEERAARERLEAAQTATHAATRRQEAQRAKAERDRRSRVRTRERRLRERVKLRVFHQTELDRLLSIAGDATSASASPDPALATTMASVAKPRLSGRRLQTEIEQNRFALAELDKEDTDWVIDCVCGAYGKTDDDGRHSVCCERCHVWQHSACLDLAPEDADRDDFSFVCAACVESQRREEEEQQHEREQQEQQAQEQREQEQAEQQTDETFVSSSLPSPSSSSTRPPARPSTPPPLDTSSLSSSSHPTETSSTTTQTTNPTGLMLPPSIPPHPTTSSSAFNTATATTSSSGDTTAPSSLVQPPSPSKKHARPTVPYPTTPLDIRQRAMSDATANNNNNNNNVNHGPTHFVTPKAKSGISASASSTPVKGFWQSPILPGCPQRIAIPSANGNGIVLGPDTNRHGDASDRRASSSAIPSSSESLFPSDQADIHPFDTPRGRYSQRYYSTERSASPLPPASTGVSPTKHATPPAPRSVSARFITTTPSADHSTFVTETKEITVPTSDHTHDSNHHEHSHSDPNGHSRNGNNHNGHHQHANGQGRPGRSHSLGGGLVPTLDPIRPEQIRTPPVKKDISPDLVASVAVITPKKTGNL